MSETATEGSGAMFDAIAQRYDRVNRVLSLGMDPSWRRQLVAELAPEPGWRVLDLATGTGDVAVELLHAELACTVTGLDPSEKMLAVAAQKLAALGLSDRSRLVRGDSQALPFPAAHFDGVTMAFGIRNVPDRALALREATRVTRPGGRVAILELSEPQGGVLGPLARFHIRRMVPRLGALLSGAREYAYLQESIARFPPPDEFARMMTGAGLEAVDVHPLTFGVCCLFVGHVPGASA